MTLASDVVSATERLLHAGHKVARNKLSSSYSSGGTSLALTYDLGALQAGARLAVDLEHFYTWAVDTAAKTATVDGAQDGSTAANHSSGAVVYVNPLFSKFDILQAVNDELRDLSSPSNGLYRVQTVDLVYSSAVTGYNLTSVTDLIDVISVQWKQAGSSKNWPTITKYRVAQSADTDDFASGLAIFLYEGAQPGNDVRVTYKSKFSTLSALGDNVESTTGLWSEAVDILQYGAAIRLLAGRPAKRTFMESQPDSRRAEEVSTQDALIAPSELRRLRQARIAAEAARLSSKYPTQVVR